VVIAMIGILAALLSAVLAALEAARGMQFNFDWNLRGLEVRPLTDGISPLMMAAIGPSSKGVA